VISIGTMMVLLSIILNLVLMLDKKQTVINRKIRTESFFFERVEAVIPASYLIWTKKFGKIISPKTTGKNLNVNLIVFTNHYRKATRLIQRTRNAILTWIKNL